MTLFRGGNSCSFADARHNLLFVAVFQGDDFGCQDEKTSVRSTGEIANTTRGR